MGFKKKLHLQFPDPATHLIDTQRTKETRRLEPADSLSLERAVRQLLCNKISGNLLGIWLLIPEHLRLGTLDLLRRWTGKDNAQVEPRIALQMVHEAALCLTGQRQKRTLSQQGFEVANAPNADLLANHYAQLPQKLQQQNIHPGIPWLYGYKLDFRFK